MPRSIDSLESDLNNLGADLEENLNILPNPQHETNPHSSNDQFQEHSVGNTSRNDSDLLYLRAQAVQSSPEVLARFIEDVSRKMEASLNQIQSNFLSNFQDVQSQLSDLNNKIEASKVVYPVVSLTPSLEPMNQDLPILNEPCIPSDVPDTSVLNKTAKLVQIPSTTPSSMEVGDIAPASGSLNSAPTVLADETYRFRKIDSIRFQNIHQKLEQEHQFKYWQRNVIGQIESQDCLFVIDAKESPPEYLTKSDLTAISRKVRYFLTQSLGDYYQDLVHQIKEPREIMEKLVKICSPSSAVQLKRLMSEFSSMRFDPQNERAVAFIHRFDETRRKLCAIDPFLMTPAYIKLIFELAIVGTKTYSKAELNNFQNSLSELRDFLLEEELRDTQVDASSAYVFRNKVASTRGRGLGRTGRGGIIPGYTQSDNMHKILNKGGLNMKKGGSFCSYCKKRGHIKEICFRANKVCFKCGLTNQHLAAQCPNPKFLMNSVSALSSKPGRSQPGPSHSPPQNQTRAPFSKKPLDHTPASKLARQTSIPKLRKMNLGRAKQLAADFGRNPESVFFIAGPQSGSDDSNVWVTIGPEEENYVNSINLVRDETDSGQAHTLSEGIRNFSAIIDTGCTEHLTTSKDVLSNVRRLPQPRLFKCANSKNSADLLVNHYGDIDFVNNGKSATLNNVLYAPGLAANLFSVRKVTQSGINVLFRKNDVQFIQESSGQVIKQGFFRDKLWWISFDLSSPKNFELSPKRPKFTALQTFSEQSDIPNRDKIDMNIHPKKREGATFNFNRTMAYGNVTLGGRDKEKSVETTFDKEKHVETTISNLCQHSQSNLSQNSQFDKFSNSTSAQPDSLDIRIAKFDEDNLLKSYGPPLDSGIAWHLRTNHSSKQYLEAAKKFLPELKAIKFLDNIKNCEDCHEANVIRKSHSQVRHRADRAFAILHSDLMGKISPENFRTRDCYIVVFVCDYSRYAFAYTLKNKKEVHLALQKCLKEIASITNQQKNVFKLKSDHGLEFQTSEMKKLLSNEGILWDPCTPHVPQQNGCAERFNQELKHKIRVNLLSAKMPLSFWGHALNFTVFVHNRLPNASNDFMSPFERARGYAPDLKFLKRFGCLVHYVDVNNKSKFAPNGKKGYLLECTETGYIVFSDQHKTLVSTCDVKCIESIVYGDRIKDYPKPLTDLLTMSDDSDQELEQNMVALNRDDPRDYQEPFSYQEAMTSPDSDLWEGAIRDELNSLQEMDTWELVSRSSLPEHTKVIKTRWVHRRKVEPDGSYKFKSRLVVKGFADTNQYLISDIFAPVARLSDVRLFLSIANKYGMHLYQLDVSTAFLHSSLEKPVYMEIPEGLIELTDTPTGLDRSYVCRLKRSLYGLKVSPNLWYKKFSGILKKLGFEAYPFQPCIFKWEQGSIYVLLIIYVDDGLMASNNKYKALELIQGLSNELRLKILGTPRKFLGFEIERDESSRKLFIHQRSAIEKLIDKFLPEDAKISDIPMSPNFCSLNSQLQVEQNSQPNPNVPFREVVGSLLFIQNCSRPDISFAVNFMSRRQIGYNMLDWNCLMKILQYLKGTLDFKLEISGDSEVLEAFSDSSLGTSALDGHSTTGYTVSCFGDLISWKSRKQNHVALSTCESEYLAMCETSKELTSIRALCKFLTKLDLTPKLYCDCTPAITVAMTGQSRALKHIVKLSMHYVHELYSNGKLEIEWVPTDEMLADAFTKALAYEKFIFFRKMLLKEP